MNPPEAPPPPFATIVEPLAEQQPTSALVLSILGIVLAGVSLLSAIVAVWKVAVGRAPTVEGPLQAWMLFANAIGAAMGAWLLWASIAALRMRPAGRRGLVTWSIVDVVVTLLIGAVNVFVVMPAVVDATVSAVAPGNPMPPAFLRAEAIVGAAIGSLAGLAYPICVLVFLRRPHVVAAYDTAARRARAAAGEGAAARL